MLATATFTSLIAALFAIDNIPALAAFIPAGETIGSAAAPLAVVFAVIAMVRWKPKDVDS